MPNLQRLRAAFRPSSIPSLSVCRGFAKDDPTSAIDAPKQIKPLPKLLSEEEVDTLLDGARAVDGEERLRLTCLLELLYATGMRVSELVSLPWMAGDEPFLMISGKGGRSALSRSAHRRELRLPPIAPVGLLSARLVAIRPFCSPPARKKAT